MCTELAARQAQLPNLEPCPRTRVREGRGSADATGRWCGRRRWASRGRRGAASSGGKGGRVQGGRGGGVGGNGVCSLARPSLAPGGHTPSARRQFFCPCPLACGDPRMVPWGPSTERRAPRRGSHFRGTILGTQIARILAARIGREAPRKRPVLKVHLRRDQEIYRRKWISRVLFSMDLAQMCCSMARWPAIACLLRVIAQPHQVERS